MGEFISRAGLEAADREIGNLTGHQLLVRTLGALGSDHNTLGLTPFVQDTGVGGDLYRPVFSDADRYAYEPRSSWELDGTRVVYCHGYGLRRVRGEVVYVTVGESGDATAVGGFVEVTPADQIGYVSLAVWAPNMLRTSMTEVTGGDGLFVRARTQSEVSRDGFRGSGLAFTIGTDTELLFGDVQSTDSSLPYKKAARLFGTITARPLPRGYRQVKDDGVFSTANSCAPVTLTLPEGGMLFDEQIPNDIRDSWATENPAFHLLVAEQLGVDDDVTHDCFNSYKARLGSYGPRFDKAQVVSGLVRAIERKYLHGEEPFEVLAVGARDVVQFLAHCAAEIDHTAKVTPRS